VKARPIRFRSVLLIIDELASSPDVRPPAPRRRKRCRTTRLLMKRQEEGQRLTPRLPDYGTTADDEAAPSVFQTPSLLLPRTCSTYSPGSNSCMLRNGVFPELTQSLSNPSSLSHSGSFRGKRTIAVNSTEKKIIGRGELDHSLENRSRKFTYLSKTERKSVPRTNLGGRVRLS